MKPIPISKNASAELGFMDVILSRPKPIRWSYSKISNFLWRVSDYLQQISLLWEPRDFHINERILEIPFVLQRLPKTGRILDVGSASSLMALQLASIGYDVTAVDVRSYPFQHRQLNYVQEDISRLTLEKKSHDCAIIISTIEHVGLGSYGDAQTLSDRDFLNIIAGYVRAEGSIFLTMPFGKTYQGSWYRVYDSKGLHELIEGYIPVEIKFARRVSPFEWITCAEKDLAHVTSEIHPMNGVALVHISIPKDL